LELTFKGFQLDLGHIRKKIPFYWTLLEEILPWKFQAWITWIQEVIKGKHQEFTNFTGKKGKTKNFS